MRKRRRAPLIARIPAGVREQPGWIFIGGLIALVGVGYATGFTQSVVSEAVGANGMRLWGVSLVFSGVLLVVATVRARIALEKLALRILTCNILVYGGWLLSVTSIRKAAMTVVLSVLLAGTAELRVIQLRVLMNRASEWVSDE